MSTCLFCRIVERAIPSRILYEDDLALAFEDINPQAPVHVLVIPKRHVPAVGELGEPDAPLLGHLLLVCAKLAKSRGVADSGYRIVTNSGPNAGQSIFHLHLHVLGGRPMHWPPG